MEAKSKETFFCLFYLSLPYMFLIRWKENNKMKTKTHDWLNLHDKPKPLQLYIMRIAFIFIRMFTVFFCEFMFLENIKEQINNIMTWTFYNKLLGILHHYYLHHTFCWYDLTIRIQTWFLVALYFSFYDLRLSIEWISPNNKLCKTVKSFIKVL